MSIQPIFGEYKTETCMCQYFSKVEDQCSQAIKQAAMKEVLQNNIYHPDTVKTIARAYLSNKSCSVQETVKHIFPELHLSRIFLAV